MSLVPVHYLHHTFESTLAAFGPREAECGVPRPPNLEPPHFGIWPDIDLTRDLLRKFSCFRIVSVQPSVREIARGGWGWGGWGGGNPPSQAEEALLKEPRRCRVKEEDYPLLLFSIRGEAPCHKLQSFRANPDFVILSSSSCGLK